MRYYAITGLLVLMLCLPARAQKTPALQDRKFGVSATVWGTSGVGAALEMYLSPAWEASIRSGYYLFSRSSVIFHGGINYYFNPYTSSRWLVYSGAHFSSYYYEDFCLFLSCDGIEGKTQEIYQPVGVKYITPGGFNLGIEAGIHYSWGALEGVAIVPGIKMGYRFRSKSGK